MGLPCHSTTGAAGQVEQQRTATDRSYTSWRQILRPFTSWVDEPVDVVVGATLSILYSALGVVAPSLTGHPVKSLSVQG